MIMADEIVLHNNDGDKLTALHVILHGSVGVGFSVSRFDDREGVYMPEAFVELDEYRVRALVEGLNEWLRLSAEQDAGKL